MINVTVLLATSKCDEEFLKKTINEILAAATPNCKLSVLICMDDYSQRYWSIAHKVANEIGKNVKVMCTTISNANKTFAATYLYGYSQAVQSGADIVLEMDYGGAHDPKVIPMFINALKPKVDAVLSTRFAMGGKITNYPMQRKLISYLGTIISNVFLTPGKWLSDTTSGYQAFTAEFIKRMFEKYPPDKWISVYTAGHLFQTEIRMYTVKLDATIVMLPIAYGYSKKGKTLPYWYLIRALKGLVQLKSRTM